MKNILLALLSGAVLAIGWPTYGFPLFLFFGFVPLLVAEYKVRTNKYHKSQVFGLAFLTFFIWNMITTWWIYNSTPFGMWFAELVNSLLMTLVFLIYHIIARRISFTKSLIFLVCIWMSFEYLRNGFANFTSWIQWYEYTGTFGGSLWIWIVNIGVFKSILLFMEHKDKNILYKSALRNGAIILMPILISLLILATYEENTEKYNTSDTRVGSLLSDLTKSAITEKTDFIIAPETVFADNNRSMHILTLISYLAFH